MSLGQNVFTRSWFRRGLLRAKYDQQKLSDELQKVYGTTTVPGDPTKLLTGLLVLTKRIDTGSPWPIGNNPRGKYFANRPNDVVGNGDYPLWNVVRASTAAPSYFDPETITIAMPSGHKSASGTFVDSGVSPFNNPSLIALMYATLDGFRLTWPTGADKMLLVSIGTGAADPSVAHASVAAEEAIDALVSLMGDCEALQETLLQWMSSSPTARLIDREIGNLHNDSIARQPLLSYLRYNVDLRVPSVQARDPSMTTAASKTLAKWIHPRIWKYCISWEL